MTPSPAKKFAFFPGCLIPVRYPQMEAAIRKTLPKLGVEIVDLPGFTCCPDPIYFKSYDKTAWLTVAARNLVVAEEAGLNLFTICSGCTATLSETYQQLNTNRSLRDEINKRLARVGKEYKGTSTIRHVVTVIRDEVGLDAIAASVVRPLAGLRVAIHYGCHLLKPSHIMKVDDPDDPHILDDMVAALGATPVRHGEWILCCGKACKDEEAPSRMMYDLLKSVAAVEADVLGVVCPSCFNEFDLGQVKLARERDDESLKTPAVYYFQLLGLAQGLTLEDVGLHRHKVKAPALEKDSAAVQAR
ncbi:MAG TPA: CoB--CoM heterodisulfide reductase iron-sulfur subunit B family protein [bacterium]|nr:CoB--CoM heterodisulfide reductase iron-sulfur subunit B family protein [bacterium]